MAAKRWSLDQRRCSHSNFIFENVVKPMLLVTFCCSKSRFPYQINENQCFRLPKCFRKLRAAPGCLCSCRAGYPQNSKFGRADARPNFEFCGTGRPGPDNIFAPRPQNFRAWGANILWPGCENVAVRAAMALKVARLRYLLTDIMFVRSKVQK